VRHEGGGVIVFRVERWRDLRAEMLPLLERHWREVAVNQAEVPLDINQGRYDSIDEDERLHIVTARADGGLVGYHVAIIDTHLHYASTLHGFTDVYWLHPEHRTGRTGLRLFEAVQRELAAEKVRRGYRVMKLISATKLHLDQGPLFEYLGYRPVERVYSKIV
jgi:hypothetical protein